MLQTSFSLQAAKSNYSKKDAHRVKFEKEGGYRELKAEVVLGMFSEENYRITILGREYWRTNKVRFLAKGKSGAPLISKERSLCLEFRLAYFAFPTPGAVGVFSAL